MNNTAEQTSATATLADPIQITTPEPWQWEVLAKAFLPDDVLNFWIGEKTSEATLSEFFEGVIRDTLSSGGTVFASPDRKAILVWTRLGYSLEPATEWKKQWYDVLDPEGIKRYNWLYEAGDIPLEPERRKNCMLPDYMGVLPEAQGRGYGSHILKWTLNYFDERGFETPMILASTRRSAKLYGPLVGFHIHKEVVMDEAYPERVAVFMKRNERQS